MKTVHKYIINGPTVLSLPLGAKVVSCGNQLENIAIWVEVDTDAPVTSRTFAMFGTGKPIPTNCQCIFVGTVLLKGGTSAVHVYELLPLLPEAYSI